MKLVITQVHSRRALMLSSSAKRTTSGLSAIPEVAAVGFPGGELLFRHAGQR